MQSSVEENSTHQVFQENVESDLELGPPPIMFNFDFYSAFGMLVALVILLRVAWEGFWFLGAHFIGKYIRVAYKLEKSGRWAVVTGCTDGIGKAYAEQLAEKGLDIVLISRTLSKLEEMAKDIERIHRVKTMVIQADLSKPDVYDGIWEKIKNLDIGVLVNNVGTAYSFPEYYTEIDWPDFEEKMINMNCLSTAKMTRMILPGMVRRDRGYVISLGSSAGTRPTPLLSLYSASKAFVDTLMRSLAEEFQSKPVRLQVVSPYFVTSKLSKMRKETFFCPSPNTFVRNALKTVGVLTYTTGYWPHELQDLYERFSPISWLKETIKETRVLSYRKRLAKED